MPAAGWLLVALPWLTMYLICLHLYYAADPHRWSSGSVPYISGMLGGGLSLLTNQSISHLTSVSHKLDTVPPNGNEGNIRMAAWSLAISITIAARVVVYKSVGQLQLIASWMIVYFLVFELTVLTAFWDAHETLNPLHRWVKGSTLHFAFSVAFFVTGGTETFVLNLSRLFPQHKLLIKRLLVEYIAVYCLLFVAEKMEPRFSWLGHAMLPLMEHLMLFAHVSSDCAGVRSLLRPSLLVDHGSGCDCKGVPIASKAAAGGLVEEEVKVFIETSS